MYSIVYCPAEWEYFQGSCYFLSPYMKTWSDAVESCFSKGADMVKLSSKEENQFIHRSGKNWWLGLQRDGANNNVFKWNDGSIAVFTRWSAGEPNNSGNNEKCAEYYHQTELWNDLNCEQQKRLACEKGKHCTYLLLVPSLLICKTKQNKHRTNSSNKNVSSWTRGIENTP